ncbi:uncharacterized protein F4812DRAFT_431184 [Daldinia caldariorum]|uniref:uncharacterized protein n=1 Tax=Daldinia caldariorum TaxID=326644 RepID=UPI002007506F|nr:uncharacterized protein F4812DRAFT_431184 [Daldinia caldariorum]KAI1467101.1 hypothetical protein F4812DRAFT_431184 [Daldinia caldariorum]
MRFQLSSLSAGLLAAAVSAQDPVQTGPFNLHIKGKEGSSIDGYAGSCHAGAAIEGLCYNEGSLPAGNYVEYYFNASSYTKVDGADVGKLIWKLPYTDGSGGQATVDQGLALQFTVNSNVAAAMFGFGSYSVDLGFDKEGKLFGVSYIDDSTFEPGKSPFPSGNATADYQWYACWQYFTGYYYQSIGWASTSPPHNPTCEPVDIFQEFPSSY